ncbi:hypothetical protein ACLMJK_005925 [Lecanora helva]
MSSCHLRKHISPKCPFYIPKSTRRRQLHHLPQLTHHDHFCAHGVGKMLSPSSYDYAWTSYQSYILSILNQMTVDTPQEYRMTKDILLTFARDPAAASLFNHASAAWSNHQFFSALSPEPTKPSPRLIEVLERSFGSMESLRATMIATANAMFGPGYVWLVKRRDTSISVDDTVRTPFALLTTYIAGSPLPGAHYRKQEADTNTALKAGSFGPQSGMGPKVAPGGANIEVMLGVNTWQHVWLRDYGFGGKKRYLENWWDCVDWKIVEQNAQLDTGSRKRGL